MVAMGGPFRLKRLRLSPSLFILALCLAPLLQAASDRGGSFTLSPAVLMPVGRLAKTTYAGPQANLLFDIGINPRYSVIFGASYADLESKLTPDARLMIAPAWFGFKSKAQIGPSVEVFWDTAAELVYEKESYLRKGNGAVENLDGGIQVGTGLDLWLTPWLLAGVESLAHLVIEKDEVFPFVQLGIRLGLRG
jgi:hypothetical protein